MHNSGQHRVLALGKRTSALRVRHGSCQKTILALEKPRFTENAKTTHKRCETRACQKSRPGWGKRGFTTRRHARRLFRTEALGTTCVRKTSVARIWRRFWANRTWRATLLNRQTFDKRKFPSQVVSTRVFFVHPAVSKQFGRKCRQEIASSRSKSWSKRRGQRKPVNKNTERKDTRGPAGCAEHLNRKAPPSP